MEKINGQAKAKTQPKAKTPPGLLMPALENARHEKFAQEIFQGKSADEAYKNAGYQPSRKNASRLKTKEDIQRRIAEYQSASTLRVEVTVASLLQEAAEIQRLAQESGQHSAAVAALTAKAKLAGLWVDKSETENVNTNYVVSGDPVTDVADWEAEHSPKH